MKTKTNRHMAQLAFAALCGGLFLLTGCVNPMGATKSSPPKVYRQLHDNAVSAGHASMETREIIHRYDLAERFKNAPDEVLHFLHDRAVETKDPDLIYALSELNYLTGERLRRDVKPWETRDPRDYYLASAVYAWFFLFDGTTNVSVNIFDDRITAAAAFYNCGLAWALKDRRGASEMARLADSTRELPAGRIEVKFSQPGFPWPLTNFTGFAVADDFLVRGLSVRNRQSGLGAPLVALSKPVPGLKFSRPLSATAFLRVEGGLAGLAANQCRASLELYSPYEKTSVTVDGRSVPLETDTTIPLAYALNQSRVWDLGMMQFLSAEQQIPSDVYLTRPYKPGLMPVVFVHGTMSSPIWWSEMFNTLMADPALREHFQFWFFIYNSGNPIAFSAIRLREALTAKIKELDPDGKDAALQQMVIIGHSQGGLLAKLTATDTGDRLWHVVNTNRVEDLRVSESQKTLIKHLMFYEALPCVKRVVFISTPHRGSYRIGSLVTGLVRRLVSFPSKFLDKSKEFVGLKEKLDFPKELRGIPTSVDNMSPKNPFLLELAKIPLAPGVKGHSIISVKESGDLRRGRDGVVSYQSAHLDYVESELVVRSGHSCQGRPATIEEVRRILKEQLAEPSAPANP